MTDTKERRFNLNGLYIDEVIHPAKGLRGEIRVPGDKSISHRAIMLGSLAEGKTLVRNFLLSADCRSTISCFRQLGAGIDLDEKEDTVTIEGKGLHGLKDPEKILYAGNSGTTTRLLSGILAGQSFSSAITGDGSLRMRPMKRVLDPLLYMGADVSSGHEDGHAPLYFHPAKLHGVHYATPVASAQVKSCILLAGLYADGETLVTEPAPSRDHTERMLRAFGGDVRSEGTTIRLTPGRLLSGQEVDVPGDISSAAFFLAAGLIVPNSEIRIREVNLNPTRAGILDVIRQMGGHLIIENEHQVSGEPVGDLTVSSSTLHGVEISGDMIPALIDEIPIIAVLAAYAEGTTIIRDAGELKVKESDRIRSITDNLRLMGAEVRPRNDGMVIEGGRPLHGVTIGTELDHRIAMAFSIAALAAEGPNLLDHPECVTISYPDFYRTLDSLRVSGDTNA